MAPPPLAGEVSSDSETEGPTPRHAPSTMLRMVPLPRVAGEEQVGCLAN